MRLDGRIVIVTGASSGFGRAIAVRVAREGANVVIADLDEIGGKETASLVQEAGQSTRTVCVPSSNRGDRTVRRAVAANECRS